MRTSSATRSISEDSAEDALEMSRGVQGLCGRLRPRDEGDLRMMTNMFVKANATNTAQVTTQRMDEKRNAEGKEHEAKIGEKGGAKKAKKVAGKNDGTEAKMDQELVYYEFLNMLTRISFQRANPTFGNFGTKAEIGHLPGCLERMIVEEIFPRSRRARDLPRDGRRDGRPDHHRVPRRMHGGTSRCANDAEERITDKLASRTGCASARTALGNATPPGRGRAQHFRRRVALPPRIEVNGDPHRSRAAPTGGRSRPQIKAPSWTRSSATRWAPRRRRRPTTWPCSTLTSSSSAWRAAASTSTRRQGDGAGRRVASLRTCSGRPRRRRSSCAT